MLTTTRHFLLAVLLLLPLTACDEQPEEAFIPPVFVNEDLNLNNIEYNALRQPGGYVYLDAGFRGIIVYRGNGGMYLAFERACTYDPRSSCAPVSVDESTLFMVHTCCTSTFNFNGDPTGGPARLPLRRYSAVVEGSYLYIRGQ